MRPPGSGFAGPIRSPDFPIERIAAERLAEDAAEEVLLVGGGEHQG